MFHTPAHKNVFAPAGQFVQYPGRTAQSVDAIDAFRKARNTGHYVALCFLIEANWDVSAAIAAYDAYDAPR